METCQCVKKHAPKVIVPDVHHILPKAWGGSDTANNRITICATTHHSVHHLLDRYVALQAEPPMKELHAYPMYVRGLAIRAIGRHGRIPPRAAGATKDPA